LKTERKRVVRLGKIYEVKSFAGPKVFVKATKLDARGLGFFGNVARKEDLKNLKEAGVPFDAEKDWPDNCETFVFMFHIIREVRGPRKKSKNIEKSRNKNRRKVRNLQCLSKK
tara:strand:+ start:4996 stop:5334 length:339 start_codon:yes stop_codon:yes gene_type:complete